jgi:predicted nucleotidyltransferase
MNRISPALRKEITQRLVDEFNPEAVYLFGSYAWGQPEPGSDLDLLVIIQDSHQQPVQRAVRAQHSLRGVPVAVDVLVKTSAEVERYRHVHASLEAQILEKGKLLYGRRKKRVGSSLAVQSQT